MIIILLVISIATVVNVIVITVVSSLSPWCYLSNYHICFSIHVLSTIVFTGIA